MNPEPKTIEEFRLAIAALKLSHQSEMSAATTREANLKKELLDSESRNADLESILRRYKAKFGSLDAQKRPGITRPNFRG
jgi:hypothetical protein